MSSLTHLPQFPSIGPSGSAVGDKQIGVAAARKYLEATDQIRIVDPSYGSIRFESITKQDLQAKGTILPKGAKHFARKAQLLQNLNTILNSAGYSDPGVNVHMSGLRISQTMEELADLQEFKIVEKDIRVMEQTDTQKVVNAGEQIAMEDVAASEVEGEYLQNEVDTMI